MGLIIKACACGTTFEAKTNRRQFCDDCQKKRLAQQVKENKKRYLQTEHGKQKALEDSRASYYRHREERLERCREYYQANKEKRREQFRLRNQAKPALCMHCKREFERVGNERICPTCIAMRDAEIRKQKEQKQREREEQKAIKLAMAQKKNLTKNHKRVIKNHQFYKKLTSNTAEVIPSEEEKLSMFRAALARHRAA